MFASLKKKFCLRSMASLDLLPSTLPPRCRFVWVEFDFKISSLATPVSGLSCLETLNL